MELKDRAASPNSHQSSCNVVASLGDIPVAPRDGEVVSLGDVREVDPGQLVLLNHVELRNDIPLQLLELVDTDDGKCFSNLVR